jgi:hypothetical protein
MRTTTAIIVLALALPAVAGAGLGDVLASWQVPPGQIYVNGIAWVGDIIYLKGKNPEYEGIRITKCNPRGSLLSTFHLVWRGYLPRYGLTFDGTYLWTIEQDYLNTVPIDVCERYTTTGSAAGGFCPHPYYWGSIALTTDGEYIYTHFPRKPIIEKHTPSGTLVASYSLPILPYSDMVYYKRQLWYYGWGDLVYGVALNGSVAASFPAPGGSCDGTAFDGEYLWTIDRNNPQYVYKVDIDVVGVAPASLGRVKAIFR